MKLLSESIDRHYDHVIRRATYEDSVFDIKKELESKFGPFEDDLTVQHNCSCSHDCCGCAFESRTVITEECGRTVVTTKVLYNV